eukprot:354002-Chlamydomonas_euryale.AAC.4
MGMACPLGGVAWHASFRWAGHGSGMPSGWERHAVRMGVACHPDGSGMPSGWEWHAVRMGVACHPDGSGMPSGWEWHSLCPPGGQATSPHSLSC